MEIDEDDEDYIEQQRLLREIKDLKALTASQTWLTSQGDNDDHAAGSGYEDESSLIEINEGEEDDPVQVRMAI